ncbi:MerR family transcriptional regulator [Kitasatospora sp. NPDC004240]
MHDDLITIGELSARTRLSPKALRLYGDRGLLAPARTDPRTGVRRYGPEQVERARRIALLRGAGMPLADVAAVLDPGGEESVRLLDAYWRREENAHAARREMARYARTVLSGEEPTVQQSTYTIAERDVPEQQVVSIQGHADAARLPDFLAEATEELFAHLRAVGACLSGPVFAIYHGHVDQDSDGPVEVCAPTANAVAPAGRVGVRIEPARHEAFLELPREAGGFAGMLAAHNAVQDWLTARGLGHCASPREVYHPNRATAAHDEHALDVAYPFIPSA